MATGTGTAAKPWLQDSVHVIKSGAVYRAQPPTKTTQAGQDVTWDGLGRVLELPQQSGLDNYRYNAAKTQVTATVTASPGSYFEYVLKCEGHVVEGNSPPVIVVES